ncbi:hypothetical protein SDC9_128959 [bioreactor metagenome]|uniref:Uncharacterized protein n=1 Tax=bioreactor metagenome TaxID=1076179 RepID=A0A645CZA1_9ZZZZ
MPEQPNQQHPSGLCEIERGRHGKLRAFRVLRPPYDKKCQAQMSPMDICAWQCETGGCLLHLRKSGRIRTYRSFRLAAESLFCSRVPHLEQRRIVGFAPKNELQPGHLQFKAVNAITHARKKNNTIENTVLFIKLKR